MPRSDERIKKDVVDQLYWDVRVDASDVEVKVNQNVVELTGRVPSGRAKWAAEEDSRMVSGVVSVLNDLEVKYQETHVLPTDEEIRSSIERTILWDPDLDGSKIEVRVASGLVTLEGVVDAFWKKIVLEGTAKSTAGVWRVVDKLAVVPTADTVDEEIAGDLDAALERNALVDREDVDLKVAGGVVELRGQVANVSAKNAAFNTALYTLGVQSVRDNLTVRF
jgi:osmotically-inducible protein OsmY